MTTKLKIIQFLEILYKYSDAKNPMSMDEIISRLQSDYGIKACRQTVADYIRCLNDLEIPIEVYKKKYYYDNRLFEDGEIELLCHSVMANSSIPLDFSKDLILKLKRLQSTHFANGKNLAFNIYNVDKRDNKDLFLNVERISHAIDNQKVISFSYHRYDYRKELCDSNNKRYYVIPLCTLAYQSRFYLAASSHDDSYDGIRHYRIDKIKDIKLENDVDKTIVELDPYAYSRHRLYMQAGPINEYELEVANNHFIFDELVDVCGLDIDIEAKSKDSYRVLVKAPESAIIYFVCQYIQYVKLLKPANTKNKIIDILKNKLQEYETSE